MIFLMQDCDCDIDNEISNITQSEPFIAVTGTPGQHESQVFVGAEKFILLESKSLKDSIIDLIGVYFIFNIAYPKRANAILLFFQHYVFKIKDQQPMPNPTTKLVGNLQKIN